MTWAWLYLMFFVELTIHCVVVVGCSELSSWMIQVRDLGGWSSMRFEVGSIQFHKEVALSLVRSTHHLICGETARLAINSVFMLGFSSFDSSKGGKEEQRSEPLVFPYPPAWSYQQPARWCCVHCVQLDVCFTMLPLSWRCFRQHKLLWRAFSFFVQLLRLHIWLYSCVFLLVGWGNKPTNFASISEGQIYLIAGNSRTHKILILSLLSNMMIPGLQVSEPHHFPLTHPRSRYEMWCGSTFNMHHFLKESSSFRRM